ncbi:hypothetical protein FAES_4027 [Fibrella aestuarina BUZ 2]|uniref:Uncharacterized protein n=1 Tax=Fibrella aestuarina BUZ 2 TaxID=1166018 RepID=I0KD24_9BACT|nr:hypothetical protein [Fibrella aestuarina]CCH02027.1 hypothetical protein FAES_4027 [Fibrella aestuarina BUZ 2]
MLRYLILFAFALLTAPSLQAQSTSLDNIEMPPQLINGDTVRRSLLISDMNIERLDFRNKWAVLLVDVLHYTLEKEARVATTDSLGNALTYDTLVVKRPYEKGFAFGSNGIIRYRLEVRNDRFMDVTTGRAVTDTTPEADRIREFDFFRLLMQPESKGGLHMGLEELIMNRFGLYVAEGAFDTNEYRYR